MAITRRHDVNLALASGRIHADHRRRAVQGHAVHAAVGAAPVGDVRDHVNRGRRLVARFVTVGGPVAKAPRSQRPKQLPPGVGSCSNFAGVARASCVCIDVVGDTCRGQASPLGRPRVPLPLVGDGDLALAIDVLISTSGRSQSRNRSLHHLGCSSGRPFASQDSGAGRRPLAASAPNAITTAAVVEQLDERGRSPTGPPPKATDVLPRARRPRRVTLTIATNLSQGSR